MKVSTNSFLATPIEDTDLKSFFMPNRAKVGQPGMFLGFEVKGTQA
jgi:hypothetical protein